MVYFQKNIEKYCITQNTFYILVGCDKEKQHKKEKKKKAYSTDEDGNKKWWKEKLPDAPPQHAKNTLWKVSFAF